MKHLLLILTLLSPRIAASEERPLLDELSQLVWKNRIILIWSDQIDTDHESVLKKYDYEIKDRDIVWFVINDAQVVTNYAGKLSREFVARTKERYPETRGKVLLIGKDGGIKDSDNKLRLNSIFNEIDAMPMRQKEIELRSQVVKSSGS